MTIQGFAEIKKSPEYSTTFFCACKSCAYCLFAVDCKSLHVRLILFRILSHRNSDLQFSEILLSQSSLRASVTWCSLVGNCRLPQGRFPLFLCPQTIMYVGEWWPFTLSSLLVHRRDYQYLPYTVYS